MAKPALVSPVTVTFTATADTPLGTPPCPSTLTSMVFFEPTAVRRYPFRVSRTRNGVIEPNAPGVDGITADVALLDGLAGTATADDETPKVATAKQIAAVIELTARKCNNSRTIAPTVSA